MSGGDNWAVYDRDAKIMIGAMLTLQTILLLSTMLWL